MLTNVQEHELELLNKKLKKIDDKFSALRNDRYKINNDYVELKKKKCRDNIGRCFKKMKGDKILSYCKIVDIDNPHCTMHDGTSNFNEHQYPSIWFASPYIGAKEPFVVDNLFSGAWGEGNDMLGKINNISYIEITNEEYFEVFNLVNSAWIEKIKTL